MNNNDPRNIFVNRRECYAEGKDYSENDFSRKQTDNAENCRAENKQDDYQTRVEQMKKLAAKYQREGEGQLVRDIVSNVIEQKASGKLTNEQLVAFAKRISPLLNAEQRSRLNELVEQLVKL